MYYCNLDGINQICPIDLCYKKNTEVCWTLLIPMTLKLEFKCFCKSNFTGNKCGDGWFDMPLYLHGIIIS